MSSIPDPNRRITVSWDAMADLLGRPYTGSPDDGGDLIQELLAQGAPAWVRTAAIRTDDDGYHLEAPARS